MTNSFAERRRQQFLTLPFYGAGDSLRQEAIQVYTNGLRRPENQSEDFRRLTWAIANEDYELLSLHYTAGEPIEPLRAELELVVRAYEHFAQALRVHEKDSNWPPLYFAEIDDYERCVQLIGLCYLLHRRDLLRRIAVLQDAVYGETDTLYEDLLAYELEGRFDVDQWYHDKPYRDLINSMYRNTADESLADLNKYCKAWYPAMKDAPWHDGHKRIQGTEGDYFGYWAFEAGAVAYLLELDDSSIDHMVYPKDLVAWARANSALSQGPDNADSPRLRCEAGQPCPREGYWLTPAKADSRRFFTQGEIMPALGGDYGDTIWQWDDNQD